MPLEDLEGPDKYLDALNRLWPLGTDEKLEGDDHIRGIKNTNLNSFPTVAEARYPVSFILPPAGEVEEKAGAVEVSVGTDAQRPASPSNGALRWNTDQNVLEQFKAGTWSPVDPTTKPAELAASGEGGALAAIDLSGSHKVAMGIGGAVGSYLPFARGEIDGFQMSQASGNNWTMGAGVLIAADRKQTAELAAPLTKNLDLNWTQGDGGGGSFISGGVVANTTYHFCVIENDADGAIDWGVDTDPGGANTPSGWTFLRRAASILTDDSAQLEVVDQWGDQFTYRTISEKSQTVSGVSTSSSNSLHGMSFLPLGVQVEAFGFLRSEDNAANTGAGIYSATVLDNNGTSTRNQVSAAGAGVTTVVTTAMFSNCVTSTNSELRLSRKSGSDNPVVTVLGYIDRRGKDA